MSAVVTHLHGCMSCRDVFMDACTTPDTPARCTSCRGGHLAPPWQADRRPKDCCTNARPVQKEERKQLRLVGGDWWICQDCRRVQPFNPNQNRSHT